MNHPFLLRASVFAVAASLLLSPVARGAGAQDTGGAPTAQTEAERQVAAGGNSPGYDMAPETTLKVVEAAVAAIPNRLPAGPFEPTWASLRQNYTVPAWFGDAKFGIFLHWGLYSVPAHGNEWYETHLYGNAGYLQWHTEHFGPLDTFGYKDFIPLFTAAKWNPDAWAKLFRESGAKYVIPTAEHHENFALWDSAVTPYNAKKMGPHRDLIGDLAIAVRKEGLKFGVSNHGIENFQFIHTDSGAARALLAGLKAKKADLYDPQWLDFYNVADRSDAACERFLVNWAQRNAELIDKYRPDMLWFDNGVDQRYLDPLKLWVAAYYYNRAHTWGKAVSISTKKAAYAPGGSNMQTIGSIIDFEKIGGRSPAGIRGGAWQVDQPIGSTWGYTTEMTVSPPDRIVAALADTVSKNGNLLLNISPRADGTIPDAQQDTLRGIGEWLRVNGEAIYASHAWTTFGETVPRGQPGSNVRFTVRGGSLYAILLGAKPGANVLIRSLASASAPTGKITAVSLLGSPATLPFTRDAEGMKLTHPGVLPAQYAATLKIEGLRMNASPATGDGNPR
jgi:alpha-L-fucosidase